MDLTPLFDWLSSIKQWLIDLVIGIIADCINLIFDLFIWIVSQIFDLLILVLNLIPVPDLTSGLTLNSLLSAMPSAVIYFLAQLHFAQGFGIIAAAYSFYFLRRLVTLGHW